MNTGRTVQAQIAEHGKVRGHFPLRTGAVTRRKVMSHEPFDSQGLAALARTLGTWQGGCGMPLTLSGPVTPAIPLPADAGRGCGGLRGGTFVEALFSAGRGLLGIAGITSIHLLKRYLAAGRGLKGVVGRPIGGCIVFGSSPLTGVRGSGRTVTPFMPLPVSPSNGVRSSSLTRHSPITLSRQLRKEGRPEMGSLPTHGQSCHGYQATTS
jgi:hypothetical protein